MSVTKIRTCNKWK